MTNPLRLVIPLIVLCAIAQPVAARAQADAASFEAAQGYPLSEAAHHERGDPHGGGAVRARVPGRQEAADDHHVSRLGWRGEGAPHRRHRLARAGYLVVTFDYRGWGASDARLVLTSPAPTDRPGHRFTAEVREIREVVDPLDQTTDLQNVIHWVQGEPQCDTDRIGLWGSSYSGGHVVYAAARDPRVKATVSQVPALDSRWVVATDAFRKQTFREATARARGELEYPKPGERVIMGLRGAPIRRE